MIRRIMIETETAKEPKGPALRSTRANEEESAMSKSLGVLGLAVGALALTCLPAAAQTKVTNQGISADEIVIGTHQDLSGPIKVWGVPVSNGMKMAVGEINAAGGINGRKIKMILEDNGYDPKKAVLASQKMVERDKIFAMIGPMGSPTVLAAQDILFDAGVLQLFPLTAAEFTFKFDAAKPQERLKFNNLLPYVESTRAAVKYIIEAKNFKKPCVMHQDDEYGKNVLDGFLAERRHFKHVGRRGAEEGHVPPELPGFAHRTDGLADHGAEHHEIAAV